jgi:transcriptional antiterminator Rof (Rho-off)
LDWEKATSLPSPAIHQDGYHAIRLDCRHSYPVMLPYEGGKTFPGFMRFLGSNAILMERISANSFTERVNPM